MPELGGCPGFPKELLGFLRIELALAWNLDGHRAIQVDVLRPPHAAERADADLLDEFEMADRFGLVVIERSGLFAAQ